MALITDLNWRYATKKYDPEKKVAQEDLNRILEAARLAPSSYGLQPYKVIVVGNHDLKTKIYEVAWNQQIIIDCSHLLVFAAWEQYSTERVNKILNHTTDERGISRGSAFGSGTDDIAASRVGIDKEKAFIDTAKQACISFGLAIAQAAELKIDNTPMGGFDNDRLDALLGLHEKGLKSVYLLALGYRSEGGDWLSPLKKVRTSQEDFIIEIS
jgi:nitroreductase/dihydropteridine reductase